MKSILGFSIILATSFASAGTVTGPVPKVWKQRYAQEIKFVQARDAKGFSSMVADEFTWINPEGKTLKRAEALAEFTQLFKADSIAMSIKLSKVVRRGELYDVTYANNFTLKYKGKAPTKFVDEGVDTWKKIGGKWQFIKSVNKQLVK
ncbi:MAG: nuclear transport factor 2 family protein [Armatimonadetes bacterium]|nr:nuclear transport factor 2 family protein [Armatimonadota bacterium]